MIKHMDWYCPGPQVGLCREYMYIDKDDIKDNNLKVGDIIFVDNEFIEIEKIEYIDDEITVFGKIRLSDISLNEIKETMQNLSESSDREKAHILADFLLIAIIDNLTNDPKINEIINDYLKIGKWYA